MTSLWHPAALPMGTGHLGCGLYFGQDATCDYATGFQVAGTADSPTIDLTSYVAPITLRYEYRVGNETGFCLYDQASVRVSDDGFATSVIEADLECGAPTTMLENAGWQTATVDLSA